MNMIRKLFLFALILLLNLDCITIYTMNRNRNGEPLIYRETRHNLDSIKHVPYVCTIIFPIPICVLGIVTIPIFLADLALSFTFDTIVLPFAIHEEYKLNKIQTYEKKFSSELTTGCKKGNCTDGQGEYAVLKEPCDRENFCFDEDGKLLSPYRSYYTGNFKNGKYNSSGTLLFYSEFWTKSLAYDSKYVGNFKNGEFNGQGTLTRADGSKYIGQFKDGDFNGKGTLTDSDGSVYSGQFKDSKFNGQ